MIINFCASYTKRFYLLVYVMTIFPLYDKQYYTILYMYIGFKILINAAVFETESQLENISKKVK